MSIQFGRWNFDGEPVEPAYLEKVEALIAPYGPDGRGCYAQDHVAMMYRSFHTTHESRRETQPFISPSGAITTWDGRLDNRSELIGELRETVGTGSTDLEIVAASLERWGTYSFKRFIGDWALATWNPKTRLLVLAK